MRMVQRLFVLLIVAFDHAPRTTTTTMTTALTLTAGQRIAPLTTQQQQRPGGVTVPASGKTIPLTNKKKSLLDLPAVERWASVQGLTEHHLKTLYRLLLMPGAGSPASSSTADTDTITSSSLQERLIQASFPRKQAWQLFQEFELCSLQLVERRRSRSGGEKLVLQLTSSSNENEHHAPELVETVLIRHTSSTTAKVRYTICVSSQVGCARACTFCATGTLGLRRQLTGAELLEQVWIAQQLLWCEHNHNNTDDDDDHPPVTQSPQKSFLLRNVVFMGMGEPLDNYAAVHEACRGLTHQCLFGLKAKHVTVSTVGVSPTAIRRLADEAPTISLALSLHGATHELRSQLMPATRKHESLKPLEEALDYHAATTGRGAMLEYLLIDGVNDSQEACEALIDFCRRRQRHPTYVNLIPYNPTLAGLPLGYQTPTDAAIWKFHQRLQQQPHLVQSHIRWSSAAGRDAEGACGQLALSVLSLSSTDAMTPPS